MKEELLIPLISAVAVALIAGLVSLVLAILAKDQKTSEFRQAWIDALREDVADLAGHWFVVTSAAVDHRESGGGADEFLNTNQNSLIRMEVCISRITLRLNIKEHQSLIAKLEGLGSVAYEGQRKRDDAMSDIVSASQGILKAEWKRVKRGEWSFRLLKWTSAMAVAVSAYGGYQLYAGL